MSKESWSVITTLLHRTVFPFSFARRVLLFFFGFVSFLFPAFRLVGRPIMYKGPGTWSIGSQIIYAAVHPSHKPMISSSSSPLSPFLLSEEEDSASRLLLFLNFFFHPSLLFLDGRIRIRLEPP